MIRILLPSAAVVALCVTVHAIGSVVALRGVARSPALADARLWRPT